MVDPNGSEVVSWFHESKEYDLNEIVEGKNLHNIGLHLDCVNDVIISVRDDKTAYTPVKTITGPQTNGYFVIAVPLPLANDTKWYQIKIEGTGPCEVFEIEHQIRIIPRTF